MVPPKIKIFEIKDVVAFALVDYISELSANSIACHGSFSVALPSVVPLDSSDYNFKLAYDEFLSKEGLSLEEKTEEYEQLLKHLVANKTLRISPISGFAKFDLMLIGMGPEGHVGSMFCWLFQRFEKQKWVPYLTDSPKPPPQRITFTFPLINSSYEVAMVVTRGDAADAGKVALGKHANDGYPLPVQKISHEGTLTSFLDKEDTLELS
ncbi:6-phosphogluconolactonase 2 [Artemisia annua]|uniref:6-phosphogluconolactonase 2 n=1 Tax=Artemisia annua TaxID=35608 RepID=A0A2U1M4W3_ARTAN|nr:6-phosphogluconolactonase 2 [Artemisia annua]